MSRERRSVVVFITEESSHINVLCLFLLLFLDNCGGDLFCFDLGDGQGVCAAGSVDAPTFPEGVNECAAPEDCTPDQLCIQGA